MRELTPLHQDALCEIFNIGAGYAAAAMSQMMMDEVRLCVPSLEVFGIHELIEHLSSAGNSICLINQSFSGAFQGRAMLIFPEKNSLELVRIMLGNSVSLEQLTDLEQDALTEVGNIILNACLSALSDILRQEFQCGLPTLEIIHKRQDFSNHDQDEVVLFVRIHFQLEHHDINGDLAFIMRPESSNLLYSALDQFVQDAI
jgi:chemotaxis protein CheC